MCFCVIEFEKRSHRIAQDIFLFLLWTSDTLPVQSSCFAPEMISLLRKAKIIIREPVVIAATTSNKLDIDRTEGGAPALETLLGQWGEREEGEKGGWLRNFSCSNNQPCEPPKIKHQSIKCTPRRIVQWLRVLRFTTLTGLNSSASGTSKTFLAV